MISVVLGSSYHAVQTLNFLISLILNNYLVKWKVNSILWLHFLVAAAQILVSVTRERWQRSYPKYFHFISLQCSSIFIYVDGPHYIAKLWDGILWNFVEKHSCSPEDESHWLWWVPDFFDSTTMRLTGWSITTWLVILCHHLVQTSMWPVFWCFVIITQTSALLCVEP